jgi:hypothetical protein
VSDEISTAIDTSTLADDLAVFASGRLIDTGARIGAVSFDPADRGRGLGDGRTVSGWSVFVGDETGEELEDPERMRLPSMAVVVEQDPALAEVVDHHDGTSAYWVREDEAWHRVDA